MAEHVPVLRERCLQLFAPAVASAVAAGRAPVLLDATVGLGGHAEAALAAYPQLRLIALDRDRQALARATERLRPYAARIHLEHAVFDELAGVLTRLGQPHADAVLFDLGVSSLQLDTGERGFSYARDAALDMRMDQGRGTSAADVVNGYDQRELTRVLREYGEERFAARIAAAIVRQRQREPLTSTARLAELVREAIPAATRRTGGHPAKRTFQALRIEVNGELAALRAALPQGVEVLRPGGRIVVLSYHSLEDRITKQVLTGRARSSAPVDLPVEPPGTGPTLRLLTRGAERPGEEELAANPRAASVRLRAAERLDTGDDTGTAGGAGTAGPVGDRPRERRTGGRHARTGG